LLCREDEGYGEIGGRRGGGGGRERVKRSEGGIHRGVEFQRRKQISNHATFPAYIIGVDVPELCLKPAWN
jgi:hypothetical protein